MLAAVERLEARRQLRLAYAGIAAAAAVASLFVFVVWAGPALLTRHPSIPDAADRHQAQAAVRTGLAGLLVALGAGGSLLYTARTYRLTRTGQITDRYTKAVAQLGSDEPIEVRLGGIYALERLMADSPEDQPTIVEVLAAYVRHLRNASLHGADLPRAMLQDARLEGADLIDALLEDATLTSARLDEANLRDALLGRADLNKAQLRYARLRGADLRKAELRRANLEHAELTSANLEGADLSGAYLHGVTLLGADLQGANLSGAHLEGANLTGAHLEGANLTGAHLSGVRQGGVRRAR
ncbi:MAG TPA: pentapeptide repeat-containing protein [Deinococcales bacterium]|nr:pentapeptide repeat-containing protein [Deinococcales bacterium]